MLREYIVSEAMTALGVPSTRALAAVTTGERVLRETVFAGRGVYAGRGEPPACGDFPSDFAARGDAEGTRTVG